MLIEVAARSSPLALVQCDEVLSELQTHHPQVDFDLQKVATLGDKDKTTSLRTLDKTDFFTKEIDAMLLKRECRIGIHSAKDLPEPIPAGLAVIALTRGLDPADALVMRSGDNISSLKQGAVIATSSERREMMVRSLRSDLHFIDLRGTIGERLEKLNSGEADGVVVAEAALIRLKLTHLNRMILPGVTAAHQGQLAILARQDDQEMAHLFACLDVRQAAPKRILHVGLQPHSPKAGEKIVHCPLIRIVPRPFDAAAFAEMASYTHLIFTSKSAVEIFCSYELAAKLHLEANSRFGQANSQSSQVAYFQSSMSTCEDCESLAKSSNLLSKASFATSSYQKELRAKEVFAVGHATALCLLEHGIHVTETAQGEHAEGIIALLEKRDLSQAYLFWPHSAQARPILRNYFEQKGLRYRESLLYDTLSLRPEPLPDLAQFDEIHFTSPSTVESFVQLFGKLPQNMMLKAIGPVTAAAVQKIKMSYCYD